MSRTQIMSGDSAPPAHAPGTILLDLAISCEEAGFRQQDACLTAAIHVIGGHLALVVPDVVPQMLERAAAFARAGAYENAVLALIPPSGVFTLARLGDGSVIAQVQLTSRRGAHSRKARWPGMALLAALLRAAAGEGDGASAEAGSA